MNEQALHTAKLELDDIRVAEPSDFWALMKPRVMSLVLFTALVGMLAAPGEMHPVIGFAALFAIALGAGASAALNMWFEADIDAKMARTRTRPIPTGRVTPGEALGFGLVLSAMAVALLGLVANPLAAGLLAFTIFFYAVIYTMVLKRRTPQNIVIGGVAGALPPVVAWASVSASVDLMPLLLFALIFFWTPPHFWSLSLFCNRDYSAAGIPMLSVTHGSEVTRRHILAYAFVLVPVGVLPWLFGLTGMAFGVTAVFAGAVFLFLAFRLFLTKREADARRLFRFSIIYLFALFAVVGLENLSGAIL